MSDTAAVATDGTTTGAAPDAAVTAAAPVTQAASPDVPLLGADPTTDAAPPAQAADAIPEAYTITLPEGAVVDQGRMDAYQAALKDAGLTQAQADKFTPFALAQIESIQKANLDAWADTTRQWRESVVNDPTIGGANLKASLADAARARDTFGSPEFKALLADPNIGIGNHPAVVKFLAAVGKAAGEDGRGLERQAGDGSNPRDMSTSAMGRRMFSEMAKG